MTLLTAAIAAVIVTLVWYFKDGTNEMRIGTLSLMYWGATLMWLVDAAGNVFNQRSKGRAAETVTEKIEILIVPFLKVYSNSKSLQ